jgi:hypothetical protein
MGLHAAQAQQILDRRFLGVKRDHSKWNCDFSRSDQPRLSTLALAGDPTIEPPMVQPTTIFSLHFCAFKK